MEAAPPRLHQTLQAPCDSASSRRIPGSLTVMCPCAGLETAPVRDLPGHVAARDRGVDGQAAADGGCAVQLLRNQAHLQRQHMRHVQNEPKPGMPSHTSLHWVMQNSL